MQYFRIRQHAVYSNRWITPYSEVRRHILPGVHFVCKFLRPDGALADGLRTPLNGLQLVDVQVVDRSAGDREREISLMSRSYAQNKIRLRPINGRKLR